MLIKKRTSNLDGVCVNYEQLLHPIQSSACRKCQGSSRGKRAYQEIFRFQSTLTPFQYP